MKTQLFLYTVLMMLICNDYNQAYSQSSNYVHPGIAAAETQTYIRYDNEPWPQKYSPPLGDTNHIEFYWRDLCSVPNDGEDYFIEVWACVDPSTEIGGKNYVIDSYNLNSFSNPLRELDQRAVIRVDPGDNHKYPNLANWNPTIQIPDGWNDRYNQNTWLYWCIKTTPYPPNQVSGTWLFPDSCIAVGGGGPDSPTVHKFAQTPPPIDDFGFHSSPIAIGQFFRVKWTNNSRFPQKGRLYR